MPLHIVIKVMNLKRVISLFLMAFVATSIIMLCMTGAKEKDFIRYVEFNVTYPALETAMKLDIDSQDDEIKLNWIDMLAYLGAKYSGDFSSYKESDLKFIAEKLSSGEKISDLTKEMKYYSYYREAYGAVLNGFLGEYTEKSTDENGKTTETKKYGLKVYSPIAKTFPYSHYDDFGASRTYGYKRQHLGHDMMAAVGTPVIAVESGTVEIMGWNQYGGWRIGIRSADKKRYYYYAHLRQNRPYQCDMAEGKTVNAGDVIGYVGRTGYSTKENTNNIDTSHLHFGLQLIFDESQKECDNEIWINLYPITLLLEKNKSEVCRISETKEFYSISSMQEIAEKN